MCFNLYNLDLWDHRQVLLDYDKSPIKQDHSSTSDNHKVQQNQTLAPQVKIILMQSKLKYTYESYNTAVRFCVTMWFNRI